MSDSPPAGETLAAFAASTAWDDIPDAVRHQAKRSLLNFIGCALGASADPTIAATVDVLTDVSGPPQAGLIGRSERFDMLNASSVNAIAGNLFDFDDTHLATVIHPAAPVAPVTLALAERHGASGRDLLLALALGIEVECRIGNAVSPAHYARGWHITATCGVFGAAAAAARLLGLGPEAGGHALGIAATESAGLVENLTTAAKNVGVGNAARNGLLAALMARAGFAAAPLAIEGPLGWAHATGDVPDLGRMLGGLGRDWEVNANTFKPYPSGVVLHAVADACLALLAAHRIDPSAVETITVGGDALLLARGDRVVRNERDARVSIQHTVAVALLTGRAGLAEYTPAMAADPAIATLRARVRPWLDTTLPKGAACVEIALADGRVVSETVRHARGSLDKPMSDEEIEAKVAALARDSAVAVDIEAVISTVWRLDEVEDTATLCRLITGRLAD